MTNAVLVERAVSCRHLHQLISQTTQYLDSWLSDLLKSELKIKMLEVEGHVSQGPIAGDATGQMTALVNHHHHHHHPRRRRQRRWTYWRSSARLRADCSSSDIYRFYPSSGRAHLAPSVNKRAGRESTRVLFNLFCTCFIGFYFLFK